MAEEIDSNKLTNASATTSEPEQTSAAAEGELNSRQRWTVVGIVIGILIIVALLGLSVYFLLQPSTDTARIRDVFIIFMALQSLLLGFALVVLIVQMARLINLLQNEIKPILDSTNETVSHLRGTTVFLSNNLVGPVIKLNEYLAGLSQLFQMVGLFRKQKRKG